MQGIYRLDLIEKKKEEEKNLQQFINSNPSLKEKYGSTLSGIDNVYQEIFKTGRLPLFFQLLSRNVVMYRIGERLLSYAEKGGDEKQFKEAMDEFYKDLHIDVDKTILKKILTDALNYDEFDKIPLIRKAKMSMAPGSMIDKFVEGIYENTVLGDKEKVLELAAKKETAVNSGLYMQFINEMEKLEKEQKNLGEVRDSKLNVLLAKFMDAKKEWMNKSFVPDANLTLRLTYGYIKGYSPSDATYYSPFTSLTGIMEKAEEEGEYRIPQKLKELYAKKDFGRFKDKKLNDVPVAILYNTDTSGGNSGSPVMNAYGELIGLNFDRAYEATINDYMWSDKYSRSIGVDIRYILWVTQKVGGADFLLKEMGVEL